MSGWELTGWLLVATMIAGPGWWAVCMVWPFTSCGWCEGTGKRRSPSGRNYGRCRWCKGRGERLRIGRRIINRLGGRGPA